MSTAAASKRKKSPWFTFKKDPSEESPPAKTQAPAKSIAPAKTAKSVASPSKTKKLTLGMKISNFFTRKNKSKKYSLKPIGESEEGVIKRTNSSGKGTDTFYDAVEENTEERRNRKIMEFTQKRSARVITNFMKKTTIRRKVNFLGKKCPDSGVCMALGIYSDKIKDFFGGFTNFVFCQDPIKRIGAASANGFVNELKYVKSSYEDMSITMINKGSASAPASSSSSSSDSLGRATASRALATATAPASLARAPAPASLATAPKLIDYTAYAILKSSEKIDADNLMYEYIVGKFINKKNKLFPCFLETYGLYKYKTNGYWKIMSEPYNKTVENVKQGLELLPEIDYKIACSESKYLAILIQHFKGVGSLKNALQNTAFLESNELLYVLFQIYFTLSSLADTFTHYDLHWSNVLLYEPEKDKYIEYHYHYSADNTTTSFKSNYMVKIIDYGRSYYYDSPSNNSVKILEELCKTAECNTIGIKDPSKTYSCGEARGFYWLDQQGTTKNVSADLRLLRIIYEFFTKNNQINLSQVHLKSLLKMVNYKTNHKQLIYPDKSPHIVIEDVNTGLPDFAINNVSDAFIYIKRMVNNNPYIATQNITRFADKQKLGDLHIYDDGKEMKFEPYIPEIKEIDASINALEIQVADLKKEMVRLNKSRDMDRFEYINEAYKKIVVLEGRLTELFYNKIDKITDIAALEIIRNDLHKTLVNTKTARTTKTSNAYESDLLILYKKKLNNKLAHVNKRIIYLTRKTPYINKTNKTNMGIKSMKNERETDA